MSLKQVTGVWTRERGHWVGDGFPVRTLFDYNTFGAKLSPFLMLDRAGPLEFTPTAQQRGVGVHPHRGFETVTIVYAGSVAHRDSGGGGGTIGPGDVQWMTAGSGVVHEEFHAPAFAASGGLLDMVQLWVNLPAKDKMTTPRYQGITDARIPAAELPGGAGRVRVIAGGYGGARGPALTFSPMQVWDVRLAAEKPVTLQVPDGWSLAVVGLHGATIVNAAHRLHDGQFAVFEHAGSDFTLHAQGADATVLVLSGQPLNEPIAGYGPFVMNTRQEIDRAIEDFNSGHFGSLPTGA